MTSNQSPFRRILKKILISLSGLLALVLVISCLMLAFLPQIASSGRARQEIIRQLEKSLGRRVHVETIHWRWTEGITLAGFSIADPPGFTDNAFIKVSRMHLAIDYSRLFSRSLSFSLLVENPTIRLIQDVNGRLNLQGPAEESPPNQTPAKPFTLPADIEAEIHVRNLDASFDARQSGRHLAVQSGEIRLKAPSLVDKPVSLSAAAELSVDRHPLPPVSIKARMRDLFNKDGRLKISEAAAELDAQLPGIRVEITGDMASTGIRGDLRLDLEALTSAAAPFMPQALQNSRINGRLVLNMDVQQSRAETLSFKAKLTGDEMAASGGILQGTAIGPGRLGFRASGEIDPAKMELQLDQGQVSFLKNSRLALTGRVSCLDQDSPKLDLTLAPVEIDIREIAAFARPFIPQSLSLGSSPADQARCTIPKIRIKSALPRGRADIDIQDLSLSATDVSCQAGGQPGKSPKQRLRLKGLHFRIDKLAADEFQIAEQAPFGIIGNIRLTASARMNALDSLAGPSSIKASGLRQELEMGLQLKPGGRLDTTIHQLDMHTPELEVTYPDFGRMAAGADIEACLDRFSVTAGALMEADVRGLQARASVGDMLRPALTLDLQADARRGGKAAVAADAGLSLNLARALKTLSIKALSKLEASGAATLDLTVSGRRPSREALKQAMENLKALKPSVRLDFLDSCRLRLSLADGRLNYQPEGAAPVRIPEISADPLLDYQLDGETASGQLASRIHIAQATDLFLLAAEVPVSGTLSTELQHAGLERISGGQSITLSPGDIEQFTEFSLELSDAGIPSVPGPTPQAPDLKKLLSALTGRVAAGFKTGESSALKNLKLPGTGSLAIEGALGTDLVFEKRPDDTAAVHVNLEASDVSAGASSGAVPSFSVEALNSHLSLSKEFKLAWENRQTESEGQPAWLSEELLRTDRNARLPIFSSGSPFNALSGFHALAGSLPLSGQAGGSTDAARTIAFQSARLEAGSLPLALGPSHVTLGLHNGLPQLASVQLDLMGGTLAGDCSIKKPSPGDYGIQAHFNFTGIDPATLFPEAAGDMEAGASQVSGVIFADIPLTPDMERMLENTEARINLRQIGSRALERLLYALDPYEANEGIVSQRRLLQNGTPRRIDISIRDGFLSLEGEVDVKSIKVSIPRLQRFNIARIPGIKNYESRLGVIGPIIRGLDMASAEALYIQPLLSNDGMVIPRQ